MDQRTFTPSEMVLLNAGAFAPKGGFGDKFTPVGMQDELAKKQLAQLVYAAAFLGLQYAGQLTLEVRPKKALMGLRTTQALYVEPVGEAHAEPEMSLEAALWDAARKLKANKGQNEAQTTVYAFMGKDRADPFKDALEAVYERLARRGLLEVAEEKRLKLFTVRRFVLRDATAAIASAGAEDARSLLDACRQGQPDLWKKLTSSINDAIQSRTEKTEIDNDN